MCTVLQKRKIFLGVELTKFNWKNLLLLHSEHYYLEKPIGCHTVGIILHVHLSIYWFMQRSCENYILCWCNACSKQTSEWAFLKIRMHCYILFQLWNKSESCRGCTVSLAHCHLGNEQRFGHPAKLAHSICCSWKKGT